MFIAQFLHHHLLEILLLLHLYQKSVEQICVGQLLLNYVSVIVLMLTEGLAGAWVELVYHLMLNLTSGLLFC